MNLILQALLFAGVGLGLLVVAIVVGITVRGVVDARRRSR